MGRYPYIILTMIGDLDTTANYIYYVYYGTFCPMKLDFLERDAVVLFSCAELTLSD